MNARVEGFRAQDALARNDREALAQLMPCECTEDQVEFEFNDDCPAKVWDGCFSDVVDDWRYEPGSVGSNWSWERDLDVEYPDHTESIPDDVDLIAHVAALDKQCPAGWQACHIPSHGWYGSDLNAVVVHHLAAERVFVLEIVTLTDEELRRPAYEHPRRLKVTVRSHKLDLVHEELELIPLPARTYFTPTWILRTLRALFLKWHP